MKIDNDIYWSILHAFPHVPPEAGGILGSRNGIVCAFEYDAGLPQFAEAIYIPDVKRLNRVISDWANSGISFCGLAHSHPPMQKTHSANDVSYINSIMKAVPVSMDNLYFPLVIPNEELISYVARRGETGIRILDDEIKICYRKERL